MSPPKQQARHEVLTNALWHLTKKELTAAAVIANFHWQRVIPLVKRSLPIFELTPEAPAEGSRTSNELLSHSAAARRAKSAVAQFPSNSEDLWKNKMRPEKRYLSLVSLVFNRCRFCAISFPTACS